MRTPFPESVSDAASASVRREPMAQPIQPDAIGRVRFWWRRNNRLGDLSAAIVCLFPAMLILSVFSLYPIIYSGYLSLLK
jgi:hypothetical protein